MLKISRFFKISRNFGRVRLPNRLEDYDVFIDPSPRLVDIFMKAHGNSRFDFKREDLSTWKESWGDDYRFGLFFMKGGNVASQNIGYPGYTDNLVFSFNTVQFKSLGSQPDFRHLGLAWIPEIYRGTEILKVVTDYLKKEENLKTQNMLACNTNWSQNFWKQATGTWDISSCIYYISYYEMSDFKIPIPREIKDDGVFVQHVNMETMSDVLKYDKEIFPFYREKWIRRLFSDGIGRVAYDSDGKVIGIGCLSMYPSGECVISPMYADEERIAQLIFKSILEDVWEKREKIWRIQVRSNDQCRNSFCWIEPFLKVPLHRNHLSNLCYSIYPPRHFFNFSKVFVNCHPTNGPC